MDGSTTAAGGNSYKDSNDVLHAMKETHTIMLISVIRAMFWWLRSWLVASLYAVISSFCLLGGVVGVLYLVFGIVPEFMIGKYGIGFWVASFITLWCVAGPAFYYRVLKNSWLAKAATRNPRNTKEAINLTLARRQEKAEARVAKKASTQHT